METKVVRLEEVCEIRRGSSPRPISDFISKSEGMPWVKISDATSTNSKVISETSEFIKFEGVDKSVIVQKGDLILSNSGTAGLPKFMGIEACIHDGWQVLRNLKGITSDYLYYSLIYIRSYLLHHAYDSVMKNLTLDMVRNAEVRLPPIPEQQAIAHILNTLDDKIELKRQMNETLEAMAQALFKSWFVDFDPVIDNALLAGNDIPEPLKERAELRQAQLDSGKAKANSKINDLFPSEFEFAEELGWIPKGWKVQLSNTLFDIRDGTHDSPKQVEEGKYLITSRHITTGVIDFDNAYFISQEDFEEVNRRSAVAPYDILITMIGTVGISHLVLQEEIDFAIKNVGLFRTGEDRRIAIFFYLYLKSKFMEHYLESRMAGTTQKYLTLKALRSLPVTKPSNELLTKFYEITSSYFNKIHANNQQVEALAKLRDTLLPKLMSGEIRIADAEKLTENI